jgi:DNA mismatch endonuclease Vsr
VSLILGAVKNIEIKNSGQYNPNMDTRTPEKRHEIMSAVRSKNTTSELIVRRFLWANGIRYRLHVKKLPGRPDIVIPKLKLAIFVNGCLWHGHDDCPRARLPQTRREYWREKVEVNRRRDTRDQINLKDIGWNYLTIWHCQLRTQKAANIALPKLINDINKYGHQIGT